MSVGMISYFKKILSRESLKSLSLIIISFFLPIQNIIEIGKMASLENIVELWILLISVFVAVLSGFLIGKFYFYVFRIDVRMANLYSFVLALPALGTLPLVLGQAFCFPEGPLENDIRCKNIIGYMKINSLIFNLILYTSGFIIIAEDAENSNEIDQILSYSWHSVCEEVYNDRNYFVLLIFSEFMKEKKLAREKYEEFDNKFKLRKCEDGLKYIFEDRSLEFSKLQMENDTKNHVQFITEDNLINKEKELREKNFQEENIIKIKDTNKSSVSSLSPIPENLIIEKSKSVKVYSLSFSKKYSYNDHIRKSSFHLNEKSNNYANEELHFPENLNSDEDQSISNVFDDVNKNKQLEGQKINSKTEIEKNISKEQFEKTKSSFEILRKNHSIINIKKDSSEDGKDRHPNEKNNSIQESHLANNENSDITSICSEFFIPSNCKEFLHEEEKENSLRQEIYKNKMIIQEKKSSLNYLSPANASIDQVQSYYNQLFRYVEENINLEKKSEFYSFKTRIISGLYDVPNKFPIARGVIVNRTNKQIILKIWNEKYLPCIKMFFPNFELKKASYQVNKELILNKLYTPNVIACILGILIGISGLRIIFFSENHYISNIVDAIYVISKVTVPLLYISAGISFVTAPRLDLNLIINKYHIILGIFQRFIVMPCIGMGWVYFWKKFYGGIIANSKVIRISIFIPFCLPSANNTILLLNIMKYYISEIGILLVIQNMTILVTLTLLYLFYFIILGSE